MTIPFEGLLNSWEVFLLVFVRMTGLFVIAPIFSRRNMPSSLKIGFAFMLTLVVANNVAMPSFEVFNSVWAYIYIIIKEFLVGLVLGYVSYLVLISIYIAGQMIDMRIGFGMVNVMDPLSNIQLPITANFYFIVCMLIFLVIDGHHMLIYAISESFDIIPVGKAIFSQALLEDILRLFTNIFFIGFKIAAPITAAILVVDVALGIISKAVPQLNVFVIGFPIKILLGLVIMVLTLTSFRYIIHFLMEGMYSEMHTFMEHMK